MKSARTWPLVVMLPTNFTGRVGGPPPPPSPPVPTEPPSPPTPGGPPPSVGAPPGDDAPFPEDAPFPSSPIDPPAPEPPSEHAAPSAIRTATVNCSLSTEPPGKECGLARAQQGPTHPACRAMPTRERRCIRHSLELMRICWIRAG